MLMVIEILVNRWIFYAKVCAEIKHLDPLLQQRHGKLGGHAMWKREKGELDTKRAQRRYVRLREFQIRQRRTAADPTKNLRGLFAGVLARSQAAKFNQGVFGQPLDKFFPGITACSKNRDFRFLHDVVGVPLPKESSSIARVALEKIQNSKLNSEFFSLVSSERHV
jgi:hypothetical protein